MITKVKSVQGNGTYKDMFNYMYEFEDGTSLSANHKTQPAPFKQGDEVEYELRGEKNGFRWGAVRRPKDDSEPRKHSNPQDDRSDVGNKIDASWAIKAALQVHQGINPNSGESMQILKVTAVNLINLRNDVVKHIETHKSVTNPVAAQVVDKPNDTDKDLPF